MTPLPPSAHALTTPTAVINCNKKSMNQEKKKPMQFDNSLKPRALHHLHPSKQNCRAAGGSQLSVTVPSLG